MLCRATMEAVVAMASPHLTPRFDELVKPLLQLIDVICHVVHPFKLAIWIAEDAMSNATEPNIGRVLACGGMRTTPA